MQIKIPDGLTAAGYSASSVGLGVGAWFAQNWLAALSAVGICCTIYFQYKRHRRQERRLELQERDDD